jgi:hypothetical protein
MVVFYTFTEHLNTAFGRSIREVVFLATLLVVFTF